MNGQLIDLSGDLPALIGLGRPGDIVALDVWHYGARRTIRAQLDDADVTAVRHADAAVPAPQGRLGLALRPLQPDERRASGATAGLLIEGMSGAAAQASVLPEDLLLAIDDEPVTSVAQASLAAVLVGQVRCHIVQRGAMKLYVPLRLS